jgi:hypothetical protein
MTKVIITCAVTGAIHTPSMSEYLPITPKEIAEQSIAAAEAGASIIHLHARDPQNGQPTPDPKVFMQFLPVIKQSTDAVINITTGGGLGIYGDFLFGQATLNSQASLGETILGPNVSTVGDFLQLTAGNAVQALQGEETNIGSEGVRFVRGMFPGANLWYTKALTDRMIFNQLQELADPGAIDKMQAREARQRGSSYFYDPSQMPIEVNDEGNGLKIVGPERAPDLSTGYNEPQN